MQSPETNIETGDILNLFTDGERRRIVASLVAHPENVVNLEDLADEIAGGPSPNGDGPQPQRNRAALKHDHLPRLDDMGLVEYDWRSDTVRYHPDERVERLHEFIKTELE